MASYVAKLALGWEQVQTAIGSVNVVIPARTDCVHCPDCDLVFCDWRFDDEEMARLYTDYRGPRYRETRDFYEPGYATINDQLGTAADGLEARLANLKDMAEELIECGDIESVLDYGGDEGQFIPSCFGAAQKSVFEISGKAPGPGIASITDEKKLGVYDFVMCCHVLEHCPYPPQLVRKIRRHTGTYAYFEVPMERTNPTGNQYFKAFNEHINMFNEKSMRTLLEQEGFHVVDIGMRQVATILGDACVMMALCSTEAAARKPARVPTETAA